jgi:hypothetical protein
MGWREIKLVLHQAYLMTYPPLDRYHLAKRKLPAGHPFIEDARIAKDEEYRACFAQERTFIGTYAHAHKILSFEAMEKLCDDLCQAMGVESIKEVRGKEEGYEYSGGYYRAYKRTIYMGSHDLIILLHELSHHIHNERRPFRAIFVDKVHGEVFCAIEKELFDMLLAHQYDWDEPFGFLRRSETTVRREEIRP